MIPKVKFHYHNKKADKKPIYKKLALFLILITSFTISYYLIDSKTNYNVPESSKDDNSFIVPSDVSGTDDRVRITPTTSYPWSSIVKIFVSWDDYNTYGSGTMIDKNHVLTAGHCVYSQERGGWANSVKVVPGADNGNEPFGHAWAINMRTYTRWISDEDRNHDFAVLTLDRDIGLQTGWMELYTTSPWNPIYTGIFNTAGYPYDLDNGKNLYSTHDHGIDAHEYTHSYCLDIEGGQSGSPVYRYDGTNCRIFSIVAYSWIGMGINFGPRINWNKRDCINNWITADETLLDKPDLASESNEFASFTPTLGGAGVTNFEVSCKIINVGTTTPSPFTVSFYASPDTTFSDDDYLIGTDVITTLPPTESTDSQWSGILPDNIPGGDYYVGWIIDVDDYLDEFNENNNGNFISDYKLEIDATAPTNPLGCEQLIGNTESDKWQGLVNDPSFNWTSGSDSGAGVEGYYYYWGTDPDGTSISFTTDPELDPSQVNTGIYYLRIKTKDNFGNNASWMTYYTFKYDGTAPENPTTCNQLAGSTQSGVTQNNVSNPIFVWGDGSDYHTDVAGYYYYWGTDPNGISNSFTAYTVFDPPSVSNGTYYLRVSTKDTVGNKVPWKTLYIFQYEEAPESDTEITINSQITINDILFYGIIILAGIFCCEVIYLGRKRLKR
ncbi:MAG: trypsin-like serine protease [Candidatus Lokiarchaeota archaeon]|nr:trypsin-like serine protease [Candidatus Lokiarchaeota archaeon]